ncbi:MAG: DNA helicase RecQ [Proteocatella sp.]
MVNKKLSVLKQYFGYDEFREGQEYLIDSILRGENVVGVMPTGAGKSICFQVPAMILDGITIVISPLISLMKDQVNSLTQAGISAACINSSLSEEEYCEVMENSKNGIYKIIYVAPERLTSEAFLYFSRNANIAMVTVDEAHCISQWGQDFRPSYTQIVNFIQKLKLRPVVSAFTATATLKVREDIVDSLKLDSPNILVTGFDRKNLHFEVKKPKDKFIALKDFLEDKRTKTGVVYCSTRKIVEEVCDKLNDYGFNATRYHAGLGDDERKVNQEKFIFDECNIIVATNAFGMGIDKSNVSFVVHYNMPKDIESYYQEAGRAGRDGADADCILFYSGQDVRMQSYMIDNANSLETIDPEIEHILKSNDRQRLKIMTYYCHTTECLREYILRYFGEKAPSYCGNCSNCNNNFETVDITIESQKILSCVYRAKERYGIKTIVDILKGSKNERILRLGLDKLSTYSILNISEKLLRNMIEHLVLNDYLYTTNDEYPVLKLGEKANDILKNKTELCMKQLQVENYTKDSSKEQSGSKKIKGKAFENAKDDINLQLFENLKKVRISVANNQGVPAFVIFSDSTLVDMCIKMPENSEEFLNVSGVGMVKLEKYGEVFLSEIARFVDES